MKRTILFFLALLVNHHLVAQGAKAQMDTHVEGSPENIQQNTIHTRSQTHLHAPNWRIAKKSPQGQATISSDYATIYHSAAINQFFKQRMIVPAPSTVHLLSQTPQTHVSATPSTNAEVSVAPSGERLFSNDEATFSSIYPNPASGYAFIDYSLTNGIQQAKVVLYNVLGSPVSEYTLSKEEKKLRISTFGLESGFYYYTLFLDGKSLVTRRLVVKH
ncbi:MAG: T9SS type A sorting domain-containing protein [Bacteroidota bacterium]